MDAKLINIGNSKGVRLPKELPMTVKRYEIYCADFSPTIGGEIQKTRPIVVVSKKAMNQYLGRVVVCPLMSKLYRKGCRDCRRSYKYNQQVKAEE